jgi:hypothetical protein
LLCVDERRQGVALTGMGLRSCDGLPPCLWISHVAGKKRSESHWIEGVVGGESIDPGKPADVDAQTRSRGDACVGVLGWMARRA